MKNPYQHDEPDWAFSAFAAAMLLFAIVGTALGHG
jgi:hypothetical protein